jgi:hypothetical protein
MKAFTRRASMWAWISVCNHTAEGNERTDPLFKGITSVSYY